MPTQPITRTTLSFPDLRLSAREAPKLRGYFGARFGEQSSLFHNHTEDGYEYRYSAIQYKIIEGIPTVVGVGPGAREVFTAFMDIECLVVGQQEYAVNQKELDHDELKFGIGNQLLDYEFITPWYGLNQKNYPRYRATSADQKPALLDDLLRVYLVTTVAGLGLVNHRAVPIMARGDLRPVKVNVDNQVRQMFYGRFTTNAVLPDLIGIGKQTSHGFGTVRRLR